MRRVAIAIVGASPPLASPAFAGDSGMLADIQAIMKKMSQDQAPSAGERKAIEDRGKSMAGGNADTAASVPGNDRDMSDDSDVAQRLCRNGGHAIGFDVAPPRAGYLAMGKEASSTYGAKVIAHGVTRRWSAGVRRG
jgi:hypothetical protein